MSADRIAKLEGLLARIHLRAAEPRALAVAPAAGSSPQVAHAAAAPQIVPRAIGSAPRIQTPPPMRAAIASSPDVTVEEGEEYLDDEEGTTEVVDVDVDEPVLAHTDEVAVPHVPSIAPPRADDEEAPVSSKRPIADDADDEAAASDAYADNPPRHTPPPESGRQVAAPPESARRPSRPPTADDGQPGGWREPGLAQPKPQAFAPPPPPPPMSAARPIGAPPPVVPGAAPAQVMRPQLTATGDVAKIQGQVAQAEPSSFGELLDDSLDL